MTALYDILNKLKELNEAEEGINTVTTGTISEVDLEKRTMYSLAHIIVNNATLINSQVRFNISIIWMDIVDISKEEPTDKFRGNDNLHDVLNTLLATGTRVMNILKSGDPIENGYELVGSPTFEPFQDRFEDAVAGWTCTFEVDVPNTMTIC